MVLLARLRKWPAYFVTSSLTSCDELVTVRLGCSLLACRIRTILASVAIISFSLLLNGCLVTYLVKSGYNQFKILNDRVPIDRVLKNSNLPENERHKLELALEAREFAVNYLHLRATKNYTTFVDLHRPYVSWIVTVAYKNQLKQRPFWYPIVGSLPYKGFFSSSEAKAEAKKYAGKGFDVMARGVTAYSTLGWFEDPLLSTMLTGPDYDLVNTIIHESTHATIYIKSQADFNERMATYVGGLGAQLFYRQKGDTKTLRAIEMENADDELFSKFISGEISGLKKWYAEHPHPTEDQRQSQFEKIKADFALRLQPKLQTDNYSGFAKMKLNNAVLLYLGTYEYDLSDFARLYKKLGGDFGKFIQACKNFEKSRDPSAELKTLVSKSPSS